MALLFIFKSNPRFRTVPITEPKRSNNIGIREKWCEEVRDADSANCKMDLVLTNKSCGVTHVTEFVCRYSKEKIYFPPEPYLPFKNDETLASGGSFFSSVHGSDSQIH